MVYCREYEKGTIRSVSEEWLLELFSSECNSFSDIAKIVGVSRERVRQVYNAKFKALLGTRKTGRQRRKICTRKRYALSKEAVVPNDPFTLLVMNRAKELGLEVRPLLVKRPACSTAKPYKRLLVINGSLVKVCPASYWAGSSGTTHGGFYRFSTNGRQFRFMVGVIGTPTKPGKRLFFVFLKSDIQTPGRFIYVRVDRPTCWYNNRAARIDYWQDRLDRWDLLK